MKKLLAGYVLCQCVTAPYFFSHNIYVQHSYWLNIITFDDKEVPQGKKVNSLSKVGDELRNKLQASARGLR